MNHLLAREVRRGTALSLRRWTTRRRTGGVLAAAVALCVVAACSSGGGGKSGGGNSVVLTRSLTSVVNIAPDVAELNGYFKKEGLSVKVVTTAGGQTAAAALFSGSSQFSLDSAQNMISADNTGHDLVAIAAAQNQQALPTVVSNKVWNDNNLASASVKDRILALKGKKLGVVSLRGANVGMFDAMLNYVGLTPKSADVRYVVLGSSSAIVAAFKAGKIDAFNVSPPQPQQMQDQHLGHVIVDPALGQVPSVNGSLANVFQAQASYTKSHSDVVQKFVNAIAMAERYLTLHPDETAQKLKDAGQFPAIDLATLKATLHDLVHNEGIAPDPVTSAKGLQKSVDLVNLTSDTPLDVNVSKLINNTFANAAVPIANKAVK